MATKDLTYKVSDDENTVTTLYDQYRFRTSSKGCYECELLDLCCKISGEKGEKEFPFPCLSDNRKDNRNGVFLSIDTINRRQHTITIVVSIVFVMLAILVYYNIIPNYLGELFNK